MCVDAAVGVTVVPLVDELEARMVKERDSFDKNEKKKQLTAPLSIMALASYVNDKLLADEYLADFQGICYTVPECYNKPVSAQYHSIVGAKLLVVDWERLCPNLQLNCPSCGGTLKKYRTNWSHNKTLFPIYGLDGQPTYCISMSYDCQGVCQRRVQGNAGNLLNNLPAYVANHYPVEPKYARGVSHIHRNAMDIFEELMVTYTNGDACSRLLYNSINKSYTKKLRSIWRYAR